MEALGASWAVLEHLFSVLLFRRCSERALGPSGFNFGSIWKGWGEVWEGFGCRNSRFPAHPFAPNVKPILFKNFDGELSGANSFLDGEPSGTNLCLTGGASGANLFFTRGRRPSKRISFAYFFDLIFCIDVSSMFHRFRKGFGWALGSPKEAKSDIFGV